MALLVNVAPVAPASGDPLKRSRAARAAAGVIADVHEAHQSPGQMLNALMLVPLRMR